MQFRKMALGIALGFVVAGASIQAHHSFAAEYDVNQPITLKGTLTKMDWVNPHGWIYIDVKGADGKTTNWAIEAGAPNALLRRGLRSTDFPIGSQVIVDGYRAKDGTNSANGFTVKFPDGRNFFMGSQGNGAPPTKGGAPGNNADY